MLRQIRLAFHVRPGDQVAGIMNAAASAEFEKLRLTGATDFQPLEAQDGMGIVTAHGDR